MTITAERRGQIALAFLKHKLREEGIQPLRPNEVRRKVHNTAKAIGITVAEAEEFARLLVVEAINDCFPAPGTFHNETLGEVIDEGKENLPAGTFMRPTT